MKTVFISHSSKDIEIGDEVCRFLEGSGISCWIAPRDVTPGKNYGAAIVDAIDECRFFVLILSSESNKSPQVVREVERAASSDSVIIPLRVEQIQPSRNLEFYVSASHWLDAAEKPLAKHLGNLLGAIKTWESGDKPAEQVTSSADQLAPLTSRRGANRSRVLATAIGGIALCAVLIYFAFGRSFSPQRNAAPLSTPGSEPARATEGSVMLSPSPSSAIAQASVTPPAASPPLSRPELPVSQPGATVAPLIKQITASSVLPPQLHRGKMRHYDETLAFDGDNTTAWVPTTNGIGQWIKAEFQSPASIASVSIYGGYGVDARRYEANNRARSVRITFSDGSSETFDLEDRMKLQRLELQRPVVADSVKTEILSIYRGERHDETPISEIAFNRDVN